MRARGDLERAVMEVVWAAGSAVSGREVLERLGDPGLAYTTVTTVLGRLARKGMVHAEQVANTWRYRPVSTRDQHVADVMLDALDLADSREAALLHFARSVSGREAGMLRDALSQSAEAEPDR